MRLLTRCLAGALMLSSGAVAEACEPRADYVRTASEDAYLETFSRWLDAAGERLRTDADPDVAWAGFMLTAYAGPRVEDFPSPPAPPVTRVGRILRASHCGVSNRCPAEYLQWIADEPDNAFVYALQRRSHDASMIRDATAALRYATRYEDDFLALQALRDKLADITGSPPAAPEGFRAPPCTRLDALELPVQFDERLKVFVTSVPNDFTGDAPPDDFIHSDTLDTAAKLRLADIFIAATGTPSAVIAGAELGARVAPTPELREHYCRLHERALRQEEAAPVAWLLFSPEAQTSGIRRRYLDALHTRNGIDAVDTITPQLPSNRRPDPVGEEHVAECVAGKATDRGDDGT